MPEGDALAERSPTLWRSDIDALEFAPEGHFGRCMVHRLAFRSLLRSAASPEDCLAFFRREQDAFQSAARSKLARTGTAPDRNFHLTSRDIARALQTHRIPEVIGAAEAH